MCEALKSMVPLRMPTETNHWNEMKAWTGGGLVAPFGCALGHVVAKTTFLEQCDVFGTDMSLLQSPFES